MNSKHTTPHHWYRIIGWIGICCLASCSAEYQSKQLHRARQAYTQKNYTQSYHLSVGIFRSASTQSTVTQEAYYLAGMSSHKLKKFATAKKMLHQASTSLDRQLAGDALTQLGLIYNKELQFAKAAAAFSGAAVKLNGQERAQCYFHAGLAQQNLGWWPRARSSLLLARGYNKKAELGRQIQAYLNTTGFTLQVGAFRQRSLAMRRAGELTRLTQNMRISLPRVTAENPSPKSPLLYRVHIGHFSSYNTAAAARKQIQVSEAMIVPLAKP